MKKPGGNFYEGCVGFTICQGTFGDYYLPIYDFWHDGYLGGSTSRLRLQSSTYVYQLGGNMFKPRVLCHGALPYGIFSWLAAFIHQLPCKLDDYCLFPVDYVFLYQKKVSQGRLSLGERKWKETLRCLRIFMSLP